MLKNRVRRIENKIINKWEGSKTNTKPKMWMIREVCRNVSTEEQIKNIKEGRVKHPDGKTYSENDFNIFVISTISREKDA